MLVRLMAGEIKEGQTVFPVEIVKQGVSKFPVAKQENGKMVPAWINFSQSAIDILQNKLTTKKTLKVYNGHVSQEEMQGKMHRPLTDWIATLQGPYETQPDDKGISTLTGALKVHNDTPTGNVLLNRIHEAPGEVKFSLDYKAALVPAEINGKAVFDVRDIGRIRSLDFVPESGFDNGMHLPSLMQSVMTALDKFNNNKKEEEAMTIEELKKQDAELYQAIVDDVKKGLEAEKNVAAGATAGELVDFTDSDEYKELMQTMGSLTTGLETLKKENENLLQSKNETVKELSILQVKARQVIADRAMDEILATSSVPESLHAKIKAMVDWKPFVGEGDFEPGVEGYSNFVEAFQSEVKDWEEKLPEPSVTIGLGDPKEDAVIMGSMAKLKEEFSEIIKDLN